MLLLPLSRLALFLFALCPSCAGSNDFGRKFLEEHTKKAGVTTLASGLQYKILQGGSGDSHPTASSPCECNYEGRTAQNWPDGATFDSSYARGKPATFAPNQVIKGWTEAMQLMVEGDKWEMYIPSELGYSDRGMPPTIGGGDVLVFTMEIVKINGQKISAGANGTSTRMSVAAAGLSSTTSLAAASSAAGHSPPGAPVQAARLSAHNVTLMEELKSLEPERFKNAGAPLWAWLAINGLSMAAIVALALLCGCFGLHLARSSRELRQFRAPLQEEVMELSGFGQGPQAPYGDPWIKAALVTMHL